MWFSTFSRLFSLKGGGVVSIVLPCFVAAIIVMMLPMDKFAMLFYNNVENVKIPATVPLDPVLNSLINNNNNNNRIISDTRPVDCIYPDITVFSSSSSSFRATIVIYPDRKHAEIVDYQLTLTSILKTTELFYDKLEIALINGNDDDDDEGKLKDEVVQYLQQFTESKMPVFTTIKPQQDRKTLFHELLEIGEQVNGNIVVYLASGVECNTGWLEAMIRPFLHQEQPENKQDESSISQFPPPVIVMPHFDGLAWVADIKDNKKRGWKIDYVPRHDFVRLLFNWSLKPMWYELSYEELVARNSEAEAITTPLFLTNAFAVNKKSPLYAQLYARLIDGNENNDTTTFEAAQFIWRCLNGAVVLAPCARIGSFNAYSTLNDVDPKIANIKEALAKKGRSIIGTWFQLNPQQPGPKDCSRSFSWFLENVAKEVILPKKEYVAFGYLRSNGRFCFKVSIDHRLIGIRCSILGDASMFYFEKNGLIRSRTGFCVNIPTEAEEYVKLVDCDPDDKQQQWLFTPDGMIKSLYYNKQEKCLMHASDPNDLNEADPVQVLMLTKCLKPEDENEYGDFFRFSFTHRLNT